MKAILLPSAADKKKKEIYVIKVCIESAIEAVKRKIEDSNLVRKENALAIYNCS